MTNNLPKQPKQLSFSFMQEIESTKMVDLSSREENELIQSLAELIIAHTQTRKLTSNTGAYDDR